MAFEGDLKSVSLPMVLQRLSGQSSTGILTVQGQDDIVAISLLEGQIVTADSLNQTAETGLGEVLTSRNLLKPEQFSTVVREHQSGGGSLGDLLVEKGLLSREQLLEALRHQTYRLMLQVLTWRVGEFKFYGGDEVSYEDGFVPISTEELQVRAIEDIGARSGLGGELPSEDAAYRKAAGGVELRVYGRDGDGTGGGHWVGEKQAAFLGQLDGQLSAGDVAKAMGLDRYRTVFWLYRGLQQGLLERVVAGGPRPAPRPAAPAPRATGTMPAVRPSPTRQPTPQPSGSWTPPASLRPPPPAVPLAIGPSPAGEVFVPPEPEVYDDVEDEAPVPVGGLAVALAALLLVLAALALLQEPASFVLPYPWQDNRQSTVERYLRQSLFEKIDRAAKTYFLVEAHYPDSLDDAIGLGLLVPPDTRDPAGNALVYQTEGLRYTIALIGRDGAAIEGAGETEAITGDFLLDPQFIPAEASVENPLVLLD